MAQTAAVGKASRRAWILIAALILVALAASGGIWWGRRGTGNADRVRFTPIEVTWPNVTHAIWSPDGKAITYSAGVASVPQVFLRYLMSPSPVQITHGREGMCAVSWSTDSKRVLALKCNDNGSDTSRIYSVPVFGGDPEQVASLESGINIAISGGKVALLVSENGKLVIKTGSLGSPLQRYTPEPFASSDFLNAPQLGFSPDGKLLLFFVDVSRGRNAWLLPLPAGSAPPKRVFQDLPSYGGTPEFSWMPDSRHVVMKFQDRHDDEQTHLWIADVLSGARRRLTSGTVSEMRPAVSPDGTRILFLEMVSEYMLVSASLKNAETAQVLASNLETGMPAWAPGMDKFVYMTSRNGAPEIWLRGGGEDRPVVTEAMFPTGTTSWFMTPALSPDGGRLVYLRIDSQERAYNWISSVAGGPPVRLSNDPAATEFGGAWSPDGKSFVYQSCHTGKCGLAVIKTSGEATPAVIRDDVSYGMPDWSPDGKWIKYYAGDECALVSPDGRTFRKLGLKDLVEATFSKDSWLLYGIRRQDGRGELFSFDLASGAQKPIGAIGREYIPRSMLNPGIRLSLSPDGKSILYPALRSTFSLWKMEGF